MEGPSGSSPTAGSASPAGTHPYGCNNNWPTNAMILDAAELARYGLCATNALLSAKDAQMKRLMMTAIMLSVANGYAQTTRI